MLDRCAKGSRQFEREHRGREKDAALDRVDRLARHADPVGELFLGQALLAPYLAESVLELGMGHYATTLFYSRS